MFRIERVDTAESTKLIIDGELAGDYVRAAEACCGEALAAGKRLYLCLRDVLTIDENGFNMLGRLAERGVRIRGFGAYMSHVVRRAVARRTTDGTESAR